MTTTLLLLALLVPSAPQDAGRLAPPVRLHAAGAPIDSGEHIAHSGPLVADYDRDGLPDLMVGNFRGHVQLYRNVGTRTAPELAPEGLLEAEGEVVRIHNW